MKIEQIRSLFPIMNEKDINLIKLRESELYIKKENTRIGDSRVY